MTGLAHTGGASGEAARMPNAPHFDALRLLASIGIVVLHYTNYVEDMPQGRVLADHVWHFNLFVDVFFVISGFVITAQYLGRVGSARDIGRFLWRRLARIYPLHLATLAFYVAIALLVAGGYVRVDNPGRYALSDVPAQVLLLHAIDGQRLTFNFPSWSLSAEMVCYLLFPLMALAGLRWPAAVIASAIVVALVLTLYCAISGAPPWPDWINKGGALRALPAFLLGVALHLYRDRMARLPLGVALLPAFLAFIFLGWALHPLAVLALVYLVAIAAVAADEESRLSPLSRLGVGRWAHLTYSSYMLHMPVATFVVTVAGRFLPQTPAMRVALVVLAAVLLIFVSIASYRLFEEPVRRRLNAVLDRHRPQPLAVSVTVPRRVR